MKKKILPLALTAALAGVAGTAQAVYVNPEGLGQVLIYPFYTVEGGNQTAFAVVNTTGDTKAVKVRMVEGMNSNEVLDFNLYLSPYDHWSGVISATEDGAQISTADTSCTVPSFSGPEEFRTLNFASEEDSAFTGKDRTREGYIEIIEMGLVVDDVNGEDDLTDWIKHGSDNVPADCGKVVEQWTSGIWKSDRNDQIENPTGNLYGYGILLNPNDGTNATYDAVALARFFNNDANVPGNPQANLHYKPGTTLPSLNEATNYVQVLAQGTSGAPAVNAGSVFVRDGSGGWVLGTGRDAVSAALMKGSIANDYVLAAELDARTDWVVTFPTKREYVSPGQLDHLRAPFLSTWDPKKGQACEEIKIEYWNREEAEQVVASVDFSPSVESKVSLCHEANVIAFNGKSALSASDRIRNDLDVDYENGWMRIDLVNGEANRSIALNVADADPNTPIYPSTDDVQLNGLPAVGFAVQKYVKNDVKDGVLTNYAGSVLHKATIDTTIQP